MATGEWNPEELRRARKRYEIEHGDISYKEIGASVAAILHRKKPVSVAVVSYWFTKREPKFSEGLALARVLKADPFAIGLPAPPAERLDVPMAPKSAFVPIPRGGAGKKRKRSTG